MRFGARMGDTQCVDSVLLDGLHDAFSTKHSGWHTEDLVQKYGLTREAQDAYAARSQQRFAAAQAAGYFSAEIEPLMVESEKGVIEFAADESNRPDTTVETLARLKPATRPDGTITAGNAPGVNAGAAAMVVCDQALARDLRLEALLTIKSVAVVGVEPGMFGLGPIPAVRKALDRAGWRMDEVDYRGGVDGFEGVEIMQLTRNQNRLLVTLVGIIAGGTLGLFPALFAGALAFGAMTITDNLRAFSAAHRRAAASASDDAGNDMPDSGVGPWLEKLQED